MKGGVVMKVFIVTTLMFLLVITGWFLAYTYLNNIYFELSDGFAMLSQTIEEQSWKSAIKQLSEINKQWEKNRERLNLFINHQEIHEIDLSLARAKQYIQQKEISTSLAEIEVLKKLIYMIKEDESLMLNNIL